MAREEGPFEYFDERTNSPGVTANSIRTNLTDPEKNNGDILGETASDFAKTAFDTGKGQFLNGLNSAISSTPPAESQMQLKQGEETLPDLLQYGMISELQDHGFLGAQDGYPGIPESMLTDGNPPQIRPDLYDADGSATFDTTGMTEAEVAQLKKDWKSWMDSDVHLNALGITSQVKNSFYNGAGLPQ